MGIFKKKENVNSISNDQMANQPYKGMTTDDLVLSLLEQKGLEIT